MNISERDTFEESNRIVILKELCYDETRVQRIMGIQ